MGMFKDLKKLSDQGKEMGKKQGRPTSMMGMLKDTPNVISQATAAVDDAMALQDDMAAQQVLLQTGTPAAGTIKSFQDTGALVNFNPQVIIELDVEADGQAPYSVQTSAAVPQTMLAQLTPGNKLAVRVDPSNPQNIAIDWARFGQV
jgi:hypothetical protein